MRLGRRLRIALVGLAALWAGCGGSAGGSADAAGASESEDAAADGAASDDLASDDLASGDVASDDLPGDDVSGDDVSLPAIPRGVEGLLPSVRVDGAWYGGSGGDCEVAGAVTTCAAGDMGQLVITRDGVLQSVRFEAAAPGTLEAVALAGHVAVAGATAWLSNGFQSWSQSGALALRDEPPSAEALDAALRAEGDVEVIREGAELSWWHTWVAGPESALVAGAVDATRLKATVRAHHDGDGVWLTLQSGGAGEAIPFVASDVLEIETWFVDAGPDLTDLLDAFAARLPARRDVAPRTAEVGWNSWYELWQQVDEDDILANAALAAGLLGDRVPPDAPPLRIVLDDGWQQAWGIWEPNEKFPSGIDGLVAGLAADGFATGIWFAPLLVEETTQLALDHPDWFVPGKTFAHLIEGKMRVLDPFHPEVEEHLREVTSRIVGWGMDMLKIDFLFAGTWEAPRYEPGRTGTEALVRALQIIREAAGEDTIILAVGGPPTPALPYVDSWRSGGDIAVEVFGPTWPFVANQLRAVGARYPYCRRTLCDADPLLLRQLPRDEVDALAWIVAAAGGAFFLSDDLRELDPERLEWLPTAGLLDLALSAAPAVAEDWVPDAPPDTLVSALGDQITHASEHVVPVVWRYPDGSRVAVNVSAVGLSVEGTEVPPHAARLLEGRPLRP